jgi:hypothetical protein
MFTTKPHVLQYEWNSSKYLCMRDLAVCIVGLWQQMVISSAYSNTSMPASCGTSMSIRLKRRGLNTAPWGTPASKGSESDSTPLTLTRAEREVK